MSEPELFSKPPYSEVVKRVPCLRLNGDPWSGDLIVIGATSIHELPYYEHVLYNYEGEDFCGRKFSEHNRRHYLNELDPETHLHHGMTGCCCFYCMIGLDNTWDIGCDW